ncbi:MAG: AAA family ATPase, partial [Candidatus Diapherotrites archaeon]|nr:AAA family ATPase [Candidatus Diapherotrites archaeon]
ALVHTEPIPCDFVLVASGNYDDLKKVHPALRSRIRGYGYEIYMNDDMDDTLENRNSLAVFVAQEVVKDGKIPHFSREAVEEVINEAKRRAAVKGKLTMKLRDLGGLVRSAGDLAKEANKKFVSPKDVNMALKYSRSLERQIADEVIEKIKKYRVIKTSGGVVGRVNGLAVLMPDAGLMLPVEAEVVPGGKKVREVITATGGLGDIAKEAIKNVSAIIAKFFGKDLSKHDVYVQFLQASGGVEGDSASIAIATAVISAFLNIPVRQDLAMTGSLSIRGEVLPVGGVSFKALAAYEAGIKEVILPEKNFEDLILPNGVKNKIKVTPVSSMVEVLKVALVDCAAKTKCLRAIANRT